MHVPQIFNWFDFKVLSASFPNGLSDTDSHGFFLGSQPHAVSADLPCMRGHPPPFSSNKLLLMFKYVISMYFFPRSLYFCINPLNMLCGCQLIFGCMWTKSIQLHIFFLPLDLITASSSMLISPLLAGWSERHTFRLSLALYLCSLN